MTSLAIRQIGLRAGQLAKLPIALVLLGMLLGVLVYYGAATAYGAARWKFYGKNEQRITILEQNQAQIIAFLQHAQGGK